MRRETARYVQGCLFDSEEIISIRTKPKKYDMYTQGMRDMFLAFMREENHDRSTIRHLHKTQMKALLSSFVKEKGFLKEFLGGSAVEFEHKRNDFGEIVCAKAKLSKKSKRKKVALIEEAKKVVSECSLVDDYESYKKLCLIRHYVLENIFEHYGVSSKEDLSKIICKK